MLAMASKEASVKTTSSKPAPTVTPSKNSGKAWWASYDAVHYLLLPWNDFQSPLLAYGLTGVPRNARLVENPKRLVYLECGNNKNSSGKKF